MSVQTITPYHLVKARKDYKCDACRILFEDWGEWNQDYFTSEENEQIRKAKDCKAVIKKGELHGFGVFKYDCIYSYRCKPEIQGILDKYDLNPEV